MQNVKYELSDDYGDFKKFLINIKDEFEASSSVIHRARNVLKVLDYQDKELVVKSFRKPGLINKFVYSFFKESKAKRSFDHAMKLKELGVNTPLPVGYVEFYKKGFLEESFFVTEKCDYDFTIREPLLDMHFKNRRKIFKDFVWFTYNLHKKKVYHKDYSPGNILIQYHDCCNEFILVDINRMDFRSLQYAEKIKSFIKLWPDDESLSFMLKIYAEYSKLDQEKMVSDGLKWLNKYKQRKNFLKKIKKFMRRAKV